MLSVKPGITDFSSIVFSDEGDILKNSKDPDLDYNQLIRPWKSRLGLFYIKHQSVSLDIKLIFVTIVCVISRSKALQQVHRLLKKLGADQVMMEVALRDKPLVPSAPPGADEVVLSREKV